MPRKKYVLSDTYIPERLRECLRPISSRALTTVVAPMGYGKTTAVMWYLGEREKSGASVVRVNVYSDNTSVFLKSLASALSRSGYDFSPSSGFLSDVSAGFDSVSAGYLAEDVSRVLSDAAAERSVYVFIDDFHLLTDSGAAEFICALAHRLPERAHLIVASRDSFLPPGVILRLGGRILSLGAAELRLNHTELTEYSRRCGISLTDGEADSLLYTSEGWFSAIYLSLCAYLETGALPAESHDIYEMFSSAMIEPLPRETRVFLAVIGNADEFDVEMAGYVTGVGGAETLLLTLTEQNAFVKRIRGGKCPVYRFHHMMKECASRYFMRLDEGERARYMIRYGEWYERTGMLLHAISSYRAGGDHASVLRVIARDAGIMLSTVAEEEFASLASEFSEDALISNPEASLVLMRCMFNRKMIREMLSLGEMIARSAERDSLSEAERGNILGERELIMSFLSYNDISAMSRYHRSASAKMTRKAVSIHPEGGWTFGSPSVLMMFHRTPGMLDSELKEMRECMPHYYKITGNHGLGAELIMEAEAMYVRGNFTDSLIGAERVCSEVAGSGQVNIALCADFLLRRLTLAGHAGGKSVMYGADALSHLHNAAWMNIYSGSEAYYRAILGDTDKIPEAFRSQGLESMNLLSPGRPMMEMIENQVLLVLGEYARLLGRSEKLIGVCGAMGYSLVTLHVLIQSAAAYLMLGKEAEAAEYFSRAVMLAAEDSLVMPFAENYRRIEPTVREYAPKSEKEAELCAKIVSLGGEFTENLARMRGEESAESALSSGFSEREREIAELAAKRLSNREIADKLYLSEGSVKQYLNRVYSKLSIDGDAGAKRRRLEEILGGKK